MPGSAFVPTWRLLTVVLALVLSWGSVAYLPLGAVPVGVPAAAQDDDGDEDEEDGEDEGEEDGPCDEEDTDGDRSTDGFCQNQAMVRLQPGGDIRRIHQRFNTETLDAIQSRDLYLIRVPRKTDERELVRRLRKTSGVQWAELNFVNRAPEGRPRRIFSPGGTGAGDPTTSYASDLIGLPAASCVSGNGVAVAVIDTGIDAGHPAFAGRLAPGHNVLPDRGPNDAADNDPGPMLGHGTHVAGIVAQAAPEATILPIRALYGVGRGDAFYLAKALYYAIDQDVAVINLSLGSTWNAIIVREAVAEAADRGIIVPAAAGNMDRSEPVEYPAANAAAFSVASTDRRDRKSNFSNYARHVDLSAPGTAINSAYPGGEYRSWDGTSMATPWVAGTAALLLDQDLTPNQVRQRLQDSAENIYPENPDYRGLLGAGRLDAGAAAAC